MVEKAEGYAVIYEEKIDVNTISITRRAAIVNWLVASLHIIILRGDDDRYIEKLWIEFGKEALLVKVEIQRKL